MLMCAEIHIIQVSYEHNFGEGKGARKVEKWRKGIHSDEYRACTCKHPPERHHLCKTPLFIFIR